MFLIAGPCAIESRDVVFQTAETLKRICEELEINLFFKSYASASLGTASAPLNLTLHAGGLLNVEKGSLFLGSMDSPSGSIEIARDATATFTNLSLKSASDFAAYTGSAVDGRVGMSGTLHVGTLNLGNGGTSTADGTIHATTLATEKAATLASGTYTKGNAVQGDFVLNNT